LFARRLYSDEISEVLKGALERMGALEEGHGLNLSV
jgi:hypothetical protein